MLRSLTTHVDPSDVRQWKTGARVSVRVLNSHSVVNNRSVMDSAAPRISRVMDSAALTSPQVPRAFAVRPWMARVMAIISAAHLRRREIVIRITQDVRMDLAGNQDRAERIVDPPGLVHRIVARRISRSAARQEHPVDGKDFVRLRRGRVVVRA